MTVLDHPGYFDTAEPLFAELQWLKVDLSDHDHIRCPFHKTAEGDEPVFARIYEAEDGTWRFDCPTCRFTGDAAQFVCKRVGRGREVYQRFQDIHDGKYTAVGWPWPNVEHFTRALLPGTVTLLCGDPGSAKSFMVLEAAMFWYREGYRVSVLEMEEDRQYYLRRALAIIAREPNLFDDRWIRANQQRWNELYRDNENFLNEFGYCLEDMGDEDWSLMSVADWVEQTAQRHTRVIVVDPVTAADAGQQQWLADREFMMRVKRVAVAHQCSIVLVTHPKKGRGKLSGIDEVAGGAAYTRFAQTVMWLEHYTPDKSVTVRRRDVLGNREVITVDADRVLHLRKTRNAGGAGLDIAFEFAGRGLSFKELGVVVKGQNQTQLQEIPT